MNYDTLPPGWYTDAELWRLEACARAAPDHPFVEIGVAQGRSAHVLAQYTRELHLVDDLSMGDFRATWPLAATYTAVEDMVHRVPLIGLLHHDADHTYGPVREHLELLLPKVALHGCVCLHDFVGGSYPGVSRAWSMATWQTRTMWKSIGAEGSLACFERLA